MAVAVSLAERNARSSRAMLLLLWENGHRLDIGEVERHEALELPE
jgi:hypothetical protein